MNNDGRLALRKKRHRGAMDLAFNSLDDEIVPSDGLDSRIPGHVRDTQMTSSTHQIPGCISGQSDTENGGGTYVSSGDFCRIRTLTPGDAITLSTAARPGRVVLAHPSDGVSLVSNATC